MRLVFAQVYNNALMINGACRTQDAVEYINSQLLAVSEHHSFSSMPSTQISQSLHALYSGQSALPSVLLLIIITITYQEILYIVANLIIPRALFSPTYLLNLVKLEIEPFNPSTPKIIGLLCNQT